jgi:hypothetical protein
VLVDDYWLDEEHPWHCYERNDQEKDTQALLETG